LQPTSLEALSIFAEAAQDLVTAGLEHSLGRHFACLDACNQSAEKALQAVMWAQYGHRAPYTHDLAALGATVAAPEEICAALAALTPFHPEAFYAHTTPELADDRLSAEEAAAGMVQARQVLRWARHLVVGDHPM